MDPDGLWLIDVFWLVVDVVTYIFNPSSENAKSIALDLACFADPTGVDSTVIHVGRAVSKGIKVAKAANKLVKLVKPGKRISRVPSHGQKFEKTVLNELGLSKNGGKGTTQKIGNSIPDSISDSSITEIKDVRYVYQSKQFRDYLKDGRPITLVVNEMTKISKPLIKSIKDNNGEILRRIGGNKYIKLF